MEPAASGPAPQDGVLRFDPIAENFTEFKSVTPRTANGGIGTTYGIAGDRDGNVWWTQMAFDIIAKADMKTGKSAGMDASAGRRSDQARHPGRYPVL